MELYVTRVSYDEQGNLLFGFEMPLRKRGTKTAAERWAETKEKLWRAFKVFFKVWTGLMVLVYFVVMAIALLALIFAQRSSSDDDDNGGGAMLAGLFRVMAEGLRFAFWTRALSPGGYAYDDYGYRYRTVSTPRAARRKKKNEKSFIIAIYDLALGPERAPDDPLENEKEIAAFLRAEGGMLTPAEVLALSGGSLDQAEERMADYLVRFNGDPVITEEGVVVGEFDAFLAGKKDSAAEGEIVPYWEEYEAPYVHSGNSAGRNGIVIFMVAFTAVVGVGMLAGGLEQLAVYSSFFLSGAAAFLLGWVPVIYSILFLITSAARLPGVKAKEAARLERNRKKKIMRAVFHGRLWRATADQIYFTLVSMGEKDIKREQVPGILEKVLPELQGTIELTEEGEPLYVFPRLEREIEAVEQKRKLLGS
jgi:hypothetical protein